jgi:glycine/D-amino acid oxidase-like deaminating enzyme
VHFLLGGAVLFALYEVVDDTASYEPDRIVIEAERVASLATTFQRTWLRSPTSEELRALVNDYIDEEILYREGLALGLDRDDLVIRRRLRQKVEYLHTDLVAYPPPTKAELEAFLKANRDRFRESEAISFTQVFIDPGKNAGSPYDRAKELLRELRAGAEVEGDATTLPDAMTRANEREIGAVFGTRFAADAVALEGSEWAGPVASSFGLHLVRIDERRSARMPALAEVRAQVARDFERARREDQHERFLEELRERYDVEVHMPSADALARSADAASPGG